MRSISNIMHIKVRDLMEISLEHLLLFDVHCSLIHVVLHKYFKY